jgi:hypothetical protein
MLPVVRVWAEGESLVWSGKGRMISGSEFAGKIHSDIGVRQGVRKPES